MTDPRSRSPTPTPAAPHPAQGHGRHPGHRLFPAVHAQEKITLRYLGTAVNQDKAIAEKFKADTGITIQYVAVTTDDVTKRAVTAPNSFDLIDTEYFSLKKIVPTGNLKGIDAKKIKNADKITPLFTNGTVAGKAVGDQGTAPKKVIYLEGEKSKVFAKSPTQFMIADPDGLQRRHAGHPPRPDQAPDRLLGRAAEPRVQGQGRDPEHPVDRHHGRGDGGRGHGPLQVPRQGQHDQEGDRPDDQDPDRSQEGRPVPRPVEGLQRVRQPDGLGRGGDPVDVVAGRDRRAHQGHRLHLPAAQGRLPRLGRRLRPAGHAVGQASSTAPTSSSTGSSTAGPAPT